MAERLSVSHVRERLEYKMLVASKSVYQWVRRSSPAQQPERECASIFGFLAVPYSKEITRGVFASSIRHKPVSGIEPAAAQLCEGLAQRFGSCHALDARA